MIVNGGPYRGAGGDPYFANVSLLLHGNGTNGGTSFPDSSSNAFTATPTGAAVTSTAQSVFGGSSMLFPGSSYLTIPNAAPLDLAGAIDWTVEFFVYVPAATGNYAGIFTKRQPGGDTGWSYMLNPSMNPTLYYTGGVTSNGSVGVAGWHFVAFSKNGTTLGTYVDGVLAGTVTVGAFASNPYDCIVGSGRQDEYFLDAYLAELRVTKEIGRYSGPTCPVPSAPFANF